MIGFTYKSQHFTLHVQPIIEQDFLGPYPGVTILGPTVSTPPPP